MVETIVTAMDFVKADNHENSISDSIWMGTDNRKILIYSACNPEQEEQIGYCSIPGIPTQILYHMENVFVSLASGSLLIFRKTSDGGWLLKDPQIIVLGSNDPITSLLPINSFIYAACGKKVWVLNGSTGVVHKTFDVQLAGNNSVNLMAHSGVGLWVSLKNSSIICLYHTESFKHLQDINIASNVLRVTSSSKDCVNNNSSVHVTAIMACKGLLWVGTNVGISLTIPLPRLEGVPIISGGVNISYHAHFGPITFLLPLIPKSSHPIVIPVVSTTNVVPTVITTDDDKEKEDLLNKKENLDDSSQEVTPVKKKLERQVSSESPLSIPAKLRAQLTNSPVVLRRRRFKDQAEASRMSKTLPRGLGSAAFTASMHSNNSSSSHGSEQGCCDVYKLYGDLIFVKEDYETEEGQGSLMDPSYENLRKSDPELAAISGKVSTLDRRLKMKVSRPRSLDLSNWSVDSKSSSLYTSSGSEESMAIRQGIYGRSVSRNSSSASHKAQGSDLMDISEHVVSVKQQICDNTSTPISIVESSSTKDEKTIEDVVCTVATIKKPKKGKNTTPNEIGGKRTVITLMGGRGYINWRHVWYNSDKQKMAVNPRAPNSNDAHIVIWEKKL